MDLEKLEKLNELKEKGILTQEEFEAEKKKVLQSDTSKKDETSIKEINNVELVTNSPKTNWKNVGLSFLLAVVLSILLGIIAINFSNTADEIFSTAYVLYTFISVIMTFYAMKIKTYKYERCCPAWEIFIGIIFLQAIGIWIAFYEFLQIKQGYAKLKNTRERSKITTTLGIIFLLCIILMLIFPLYTAAKYRFEMLLMTETKQSSAQNENLLDILKYYELSADEIIYEEGHSEYDNMMERWWKKATLKDITKVLDSGLDINKKYQGDMTLILFACNYAENPEIIDELIKRGAAVDLNKAIILASSNENGARIIENLIKRGANVNYKDDWSPLMMAARWNKNPNIIDVLINNGANINDKENGGMTAIQLAAYGNENPQVLENLIKHGGKVDYELLTWAQENSDEMVNLVNEYLQKVPLSPNEDCAQAVERAYQRRLEISNDYVIVYPSHTVETVTLDKKINRYSMDGWYVTDFADNGLIISTKCPDAAASMALFGGLGALAVASCEEQSKFIYTKNTDYATDEAYGKHHLLHEKAGYYKYTTILGKTHSIPAEKELNISISEVEYKTYLRNKDLRCCINNDKISVCKQ